MDLQSRYVKIRDIGCIIINIDINRHKYERYV